MNLYDHTATELLGFLDRQECTAVELCEAYLDEIEQRDGALHAFLRVDRGSALQDAEIVDHRRETGQPLGPLAGIPIAIKDVLCTYGQPTTCGSRMLEDFIPPYDATVVSRLKAADAIIVGKTNLDEFAMGSSTESSAFGPTRNPWDVCRVPGGSSGGSAAAVAGGFVPWAIGTDTGGSIRQPASFCGISGLKPTYGRVSRYGLVAFASSLDQIGPMAWSVEDCGRLLEVIAGHDPRDSTSAHRPVAAYGEVSRQPLRDVRIGVVREHFDEGLDGQVEAAVRESLSVLQSLGARLQDVSLPHGKYGIATYYIIAPSEASSNLARYDGIHYGYRADEQGLRRESLDRSPSASKVSDQGESLLSRLYQRSRSEGLGAEVKRRIMLGTYALSAGYYDAYYLRAEKVRRLIQSDFDRAFEEVDFIVGPVAPTPAYRLGELVQDPLAMYLGDLYTVLANLAGIPALSVPCGFSREGLPIGLQVQARRWDEARLVQLGASFQRATDWHQRRPATRNGENDHDLRP